MDREASPKDDRLELFGFLENPVDHPRFWERVAEDVDWTVLGTHPLAGRYRSKESFVTATFGRLGKVFDGPATLRLERVTVDGDIAVAEIHVTARTIDGDTYDNLLCWVCRFAEDQIVEVRAYLDTAMVSWALLRNEPGGDAT